MFGICPQELVVWGRLTCMEQLIFAGRMYGVDTRTCKQRAEQTLMEIQLLEKRNQVASTLSGGMKRRLNIGLAVMHNPKILILDEPEAGLDPQSRILVREYIRELSQNRTILFSTHNMDEADRLADRIAIIDRGKILAVDTPANLKAEIGEGDVLEMSVPYDQKESALEVLRELAGTILIELNILGGDLMVRGLDLVRKLPQIIQSLNERDIHPSEVKLRENTLEVVFITMT